MVVPDNEFCVQATLPHQIAMIKDSDRQPQRKGEGFQNTTAKVSIKQRLVALPSQIDQLLFGPVACQTDLPNRHLGTCMQAWTWNDWTVLHAV